MPPETSSAHRWFRRVLWTALAAALALFGWMGWREYDHRAAIREAQAAGWRWQSHDPVSVIRANWRAAWKKETWMDRYRRLDLPPETDLASARRLIVRLRPTHLSAGACPNTDLDGLQKLHTLKDLYLNGCTELQNVGGLKKLSTLQDIFLNDCTRLEDVEGLKNLPALRDLRLNGCPGLQNVEGIKTLPALERLNLYNCPGLQNVNGLQNLPALQWINLVGCTGLQNVDSLKNLPGLQNLDLAGCTAIPASALRELRLALPEVYITFPDGTNNPPPP